MYKLIDVKFNKFMSISSQNINESEVANIHNLLWLFFRTGDRSGVPVNTSVTTFALLAKLSEYLNSSVTKR